MKRTLVIAEAGVNHNGSLEIAKQLVDVAAEAGVAGFKKCSQGRVSTNKSA